MPHVAVTGGSGAIGSRTARLLQERGVSVRLVVRSARRAPDPPGADVVVVEGGYADVAGMTRALAGADAALLVSAAEHPHRLEQHLALVRAAAAAAIPRAVYTSFVGASATATFTLARDHAATEEALGATGIPWVALRNSLYLDYLPLLAGDDGVIRGPAGDGRLAPVLRDDVAAVAAALLADGALFAAQPPTVDVTGPTAVTLAEAARTMTRVLGRPYRYVSETVEQAYASRSALGAPDWQLGAWVSTYTAIAAGELDVVAASVPAITGQPAASLEEGLRRLP